MKRTTLIFSGLAAAACAAVTIGPAVGSGSAVAALPAPSTIVYDTTATTHQLVFPGSGAGLSPARGALRLDPGRGGMFVSGNNSQFRISRVSGLALQNMSVDTMVATLKAQITRGTNGAEAHLVAIDELLETFGELPPAHPKKGTRLPPVNPHSPGSRFSDAMKILASEQSPWGGTWASRVQVYISPGIVSSIAEGLGPLHNLNAYGRPIRATWRAVMPGLALAGGLHLEMYHGTGTPLTAFSARLWRTSPGAFLGLLREYHGRVSAVHLVFTSTTVPAGAPRGCGNPMVCSWALARSNSAGRAVLANGPDAYRLGRMDVQWLHEFNKQFPS